MNPMENGRGDHYQYDPEGQLTDAWYNAVDPAGTTSAWLREDHFNYDPLGNRRGTNYVQTHGWQDFSRKNNGLNQYSMWSPFSLTRYDDDIGGDWGGPGRANGVLMQDGNITAGYNALNQAIMINTSAMGSNWMFFGYDPVGRRVKRWTGPLDSSAPFPGIPPAGSNPATYYYYDGWSLIEEGAGLGTTSRNYIHGARVDEIVKQLIQYNPSPRYFHYDARGNCTLQTDAGGGIQEQYEYDAFGYPYFYNASGTNIGYSPWGNRFLFTGREWLSDVKLYDYRNRMYQPELGRFLQPDPKHFAAGDYNLYRYCHNDPINKTDPTGTIVIADDIVIGGIIIGAAATAYLSTPEGQKMMQDFGRAGLNLIDRLASALHSPNSKINDVSGKPPFQGDPGSTVRGPGQTREYAPDGYPSTDRDRGHPGHQPPGDADHSHDWGRPPGGGPPKGPPGEKNPYRGPPRDAKPSDPPPPRDKLPDKNP